MGYSFKVDPRVYIPRPETEILVEKVLEVASLPKGREFMGVDLGTGCGNIAITLAKQLARSKIWAVDISSESLEVARYNARLHHVDKRVEFLRGDLFIPLTGLGLERRVDLVISNPPYVTSTQMRNLPPEVRKEPKVALEGGEDGLSIHRRIIWQAPHFLNRTGLLALEIGCGQVKIIKDLISAQPQLSPPRIFPDYQGKKRVVLTRRNLEE
jgi:release factor glutamine methyltransferase